MNVRLFAALREIAGDSHVEATGNTVGDVIDDLSARYGERFAQIAEVGSFVVNGERARSPTASRASANVAKFSQRTANPSRNVHT